MTQQTVGQRVRTLRTEQGLTRDQLAVQAGVSGTTIMRLEQQCKVGATSIAKVFAVLNPDARISDVL